MAAAPASDRPRRGGSVVFRTDAGREIGTGHVMRCLTLADGLRAAGIATRFLCKAHPGHMAAMLRARGHACDLLETAPGWRAPGYLGWLGGPVEDDARQSAAAIDRAGGAGLLVVDHFALDAAYHRALRGRVPRIAAIAEHPGRDYDCDLLVDPHPGHVAADYRGRVPAAARLLVGAAHAPLRARFAALRPATLARRRRMGAPRVLLIAFGGADPDDLTSRALHALHPPHGFAEVHVALSGIAPHLERVRALAAGLAGVTLHVDSGEMPELMARADLAVGAAGVSALERCVLGLPAVTVVLAENQAETAARMHAAGAVLSLGPAATAGAGEIRAALARLAADPARLQAMSAAAAALCDGRGLGRILPELTGLLSAPDTARRD